MELKERYDIEDKYKFDISDYCKSEEEFYARLEKLKQESKKLADYKGKLGNIDTLLEFEEFSDKISVEANTLGYYAMFLIDVDSSNNVYQKMYANANQVFTDMSSLTSFVGEELQKLGEEYLKKIIADSRFASRKLSYEKILEELPHILNERESYMVSQMGNFADFQQMFSVLLDNEMKFENVADSKGNMHELSVSTYGKLIRDEDRTLRENTYKTFAKGMADYKLTLFSLVYNDLKADDFLNKLQKYDGVLEKQLNDYNVPKSVFEKIIQKARENVKVRKLYADAQAKGFGFDKIEPWDALLMLGKSDETVTFDYAVDKMRGAFKYLGKTYEDAYERAIKERWCDVYPNKNKRSLIYCGGAYNKHPVFHFNWHDNATDMLTFAHEFGHGTQFLITEAVQPAHIAELPFIVVEVPSLTSETVMFKYLYQNAKSIDEKLIYLQSMIETFSANVFSGCYQAEHEYNMRKAIQYGEILDVENASQNALELRAYYNAMPTYDYTKYNWLSDGHIFVAYYNYMYSLSMIVATHFAKGCFENNEQVRQNFYKFMQTGYSKHPLDNLKDCGVDLLDDKIYEEAFGFYEDLVNEFASLVDQKCKTNN